eukprot:6174665-Pleurochrysis_carterae.AAC.4
MDLNAHTGTRVCTHARTHAHARPGLRLRAQMIHAAAAFCGATLEQLAMRILKVHAAPYSSGTLRGSLRVLCTLTTPSPSFHSTTLGRRNTDSQRYLAISVQCLAWYGVVRSSHTLHGKALLESKKAFSAPSSRFTVLSACTFCSLLVTSPQESPLHPLLAIAACKHSFDDTPSPPLSTRCASIFSLHVLTDAGFARALLSENFLPGEELHSSSPQGGHSDAPRAHAEVPRSHARSLHFHLYAQSTSTSTPASLSLLRPLHSHAFFLLTYCGESGEEESCALTSQDKATSE